MMKMWMIMRTLCNREVSMGCKTPSSTYFTNLRPDRPNNIFLRIPFLHQSISKNCHLHCLQGSPFIAWLIDGMPMMDANSHHILMAMIFPSLVLSFLIHCIVAGMAIKLVHVKPKVDHHSPHWFVIIWCVQINDFPQFPSYILPQFASPRHENLDRIMLGISSIS